MRDRTMDGRGLIGSGGTEAVFLACIARLACVVLLACAVLACAGPGGNAWAGASERTIELDTASGAHTYSVEVMRTEAEREQGLMFRKSMPRDHGMLFDFGQDQPLSFWMKNTYIPLDMVFIGGDGRVVNIARDAKPLDETVISSGPPATGVLELNAGAADRIGLKIGDEVKNPIFHNAGAGR